MKVKINKKEVDAGEIDTLAGLLAHENLTQPGIAVAVGTKVVPRRQWDATALVEDMDITVISAVCGG